MTELEAGHDGRYQDVGPTRDRLLTLLEEVPVGMVAAALGMSVQNVQAITDGQRKTVFSRTADLVANLGFQDVLDVRTPATKLAEERARSRLRILGLTALRYSSRDIAQLVGKPQATVTEVRRAVGWRQVKDRDKLRDLIREHTAAIAVFSDAPSADRVATDPVRLWGNLAAAAALMERVPAPPEDPQEAARRRLRILGLSLIGRPQREIAAEVGSTRSKVARVRRMTGLVLRTGTKSRYEDPFAPGQEHLIKAIESCLAPIAFEESGREHDEPGLDYVSLWESLPTRR